MYVYEKCRRGDSDFFFVTSILFTSIYCASVLISTACAVHAPVQLVAGAPKNTPLKRRRWQQSLVEVTQNYL